MERSRPERVGHGMALAGLLGAQPGLDGVADLVGAPGRVRMAFAAGQLPGQLWRTVVVTSMLMPV